MNITTKKSLLATMVGLFAATGGLQQAYGQDGEAATAQGRIDEIIVTAQRRKASVQNVPISITAFTADSIERLGIRKAGELAIPNLFLAEPTGPTSPQMSMRGIFSVQFGIGFDQAYGYILDGVYLGTPQSVMNMDMNDIERIEILKGPQGTLFGKNTIAGALNIITKAPGNELQGHVEAELGDFDLRRVKGSVDIPLVKDVLAARVSLHRAERDGYVDHVGSAKCQDCSGNIDTISSRFQLLYTPNDKLKVRASIDYLDDEGLIYPFENNSGVAPVGDNLPYTVHGDLSPFSRDNLGVSLTADYQFDNGYTLTSVTGWRNDDRSLSLDGDYTPLDLIINNMATDSEQWSQEFRIASPEDNWYDFVAGIYWFDQSQKQVDSTPVFFGFNSSGTTTIDTTSFAAFGHANFHINDDTTLFAGLRYTDESKEASQALTGSLVVPFGLVPAWQNELDSQEPTWTVGLRHQFDDDLMAYASVSTGFKSGGFDTGAFTVAPAIRNNLSFAVSPESITSYEIGVKSTWLAGRLRANAAIFYHDYKDMQLRQRFFDTNTGLTLSRLVNAAEAEGKGFEVDLAARLTERLTLTAGLGHVRSTFSSFPGVTVINGVIIDGTGNEVPYVPEFTFNVALDHEIEAPFAGGGTWVTHVDYRFIDNYYDSEDGGRNLLQRQIPAHGALNARLGYRFADEKLSLFFWGKNLTDKAATNKAAVFALAGGVVAQHFIEPRTWGVTLGYSF